MNIKIQPFKSRAQISSMDLLKRRRYQGMIGEWLVALHYTSKGYQFFSSVDDFSPFDAVVEKSRNLTSIQIKTMTRYQLKDRFIISEGPNRLSIKHLRSADELIVVCRDPYPDVFTQDLTYGGEILRVIDHKDTKRYRTNRVGDLIIPGDEENFERLDKISPEARSHLMNIDFRR